MDNRKKKLAIVGAGNAGCLTAISAYLRYSDQLDKITIYHDPETPIERTGQGTQVPPSQLINEFFCLNFVDSNKIKSTRKEGIMYENWGKLGKNIFHPFPQSQTAIHYVPHLLSQETLNSGVFNVVESSISDLESEIDADFIIDCRGRNNRDKSLYASLINPLNSVLISQEKEVQSNLFYTRCVATPDGWTFVIPNIDSTSYGYIYNNQITSKEEASSNFKTMFGIESDMLSLNFENYIAKNCFHGERVALNGNRLCFLEPLEATSTSFYLDVAEVIFRHFLFGADKDLCNISILKQMEKLQNFVLWHYQFGSKFDTLFWKYAKSLPFDPDPLFYDTLNYGEKNLSNDEFVRFFAKTKSSLHYGQWAPLSFKIWAEGVGTS